MSGGGIPRALQPRVASREGSCRTLAVHPGEVAPDDLAAGDVVANEIDQPARHSRDHLLEGLEHQRVDEQVVDGGEVRSEGHVVEIGVGLRCAERGIDQFTITAWQGSAPVGELSLQRRELP